MPNSRYKRSLDGKHQMRISSQLLFQERPHPVRVVMEPRTQRNNAAPLLLPVPVSTGPGVENIPVPTFKRISDASSTHGLQVGSRTDHFIDDQSCDREITQSTVFRHWSESIVIVRFLALGHQCASHGHTDETVNAISIDSTLRIDCWGGFVPPVDAGKCGFRNGSGRGQIRRRA